MLNSEQRDKAPLAAQVHFWNQWNAEARESVIGRVSMEQRDIVLNWLRELGRRDLKIMEVGCGAGWLCQELTQFGCVTGTDLAHEVVARAAQRVPSAKFVAGDFMGLEFDRGAYDIAISLEVLSHVADQPAFLSRIAGLLRPGGYLMMATQNRPALERNDIPAPAPGQLRQWVDRHELHALLQRHFQVERMFSITPEFNRGWLRYVNSRRLRSLLVSARLGKLSRLLDRAQEKAWLGWTIMTLARTPPT